MNDQQRISNIISLLAPASITSIVLLIGGTLGLSIITGIGVSLGANLTQIGLNKLREKFLTNPNDFGSLETQKVICIAYKLTLKNLKINYFNLPQANALQANEKESIIQLFKDLQSKNNINKLVVDVQEIFKCNKYINNDIIFGKEDLFSLLNTYSPHFTNFFYREYPAIFQKYFISEIQRNDTTWRLFEANNIEIIKSTLIEILSSKEVLSKDIELIKKVIPKIENRLNELSKLDNIDKNVLSLKNKSEKEEKHKKIDDTIRTKYADYKIVNSDFWEKIREESDNEHLYLYYTNTDSSPVRMLDVIANDYYVVNDNVDSEISHLIEKGLSNTNALIKIISKGGEGKSTFLLHLAKKYYANYNIVILDIFNKNVLINLEKDFYNNTTTKPFLFLLDNPSLFEDELIQTTPKLISAFRKYGFVFIVAEREFRYENFEDKIEFENNFNQVYEINYIAQNLKEKIFDKLFSLFQTNYNVPEYLRDDAKSVYFQDIRKRSLSESTFAVIKEIVKRTDIKFIFDWVDWEKYTKEREPKLNELYLIIATFYQFGFSLPIDFCIKFLKDVNRRTIIKFIGESNNLPVYMRRDHIFLRHETIASWYLSDSENTQRMSIDLFDEFLNKIETEFDKDLLIWIYKHKEFQNSHLSKLLDDERQIELLKSYIGKNKNELKCRTELSKIL